MQYNYILLGDYHALETEDSNSKLRIPVKMHIKPRKESWVTMITNVKPISCAGIDMCRVCYRWRGIPVWQHYKAHQNEFYK